MAQTIDGLTFTRDWRNREDFPTYENSEEVVRADMQYHPDALKDFINNTILPALNALIEGGYAPGAVDADAIQDGNVTASKLSRYDSAYGAAVITEVIATGAITLAKMALNSVDTPQLVDGAVVLSKMGNGSVGESQLVAGAVTRTKLGGDILPEGVGFVVGEDEPTAQDFEPGQVYLKLEPLS